MTSLILNNRAQFLEYWYNTRIPWNAESHLSVALARNRAKRKNSTKVYHRQRRHRKSSTYVLVLLVEGETTTKVSQVIPHCVVGDFSYKIEQIHFFKSSSDTGMDTFTRKANDTLFQLSPFISIRWMNVLQFYIHFNSISVISRQQEDDNDWLCAMEPCLW